MSVESISAIFVVIYAIPALFGNSEKALGKQILCIFTVFRPLWHAHGDLWKNRLYAYLRYSGPCGMLGGPLGMSLESSEKGPCTTLATKWPFEASWGYFSCVFLKAIRIGYFKGLCC